MNRQFDFAEVKLPKLDKIQEVSPQVGGNHYSQLTIDPYTYCHKNKIMFLEGNIIKYVTRHREKNGKEDLLKAMHTLQILIDLEYGKQ